MSLLHYLREGKIDRLLFFACGSLLLLLKQVADRSAAAVYHQTWNPWSYWSPLGRLFNFSTITPTERDFLLTLAAISIPFVLIGVVLTIARLRTLEYPLWMVVLFFAPILNILFFLLLLSANEPREVTLRARSSAGRFLPESQIGSATLAVLITSGMTVLFTVMSTRMALSYGGGLFIALPFCLGLLTSLLYGYRRPRTLLQCLTVSVIAVAIPGVALLLTAIEGLACLAFAIPLSVPLAAVGGLVGWAIQSRPMHEIPVSMLMLSVLFTPGVIGVEGWWKPVAPVFRVQSSIEIAAPPEAVWNQVVAFADIPEPTEWLFRTGIAYPIRASIEGRGPGAVRKCEFSTGQFIEPIEVWDEPRLLRFGVTHNPPPMNEWSPYGHLDTPHLRGYLVSRRGQFLLTALPNGHTRLEGTTWYSHGLQPAGYWRNWSDYIIHRIHMRVLEHIKGLAEKG